MGIWKIRSWQVAKESEKHIMFIYNFLTWNANGATGIFRFATRRLEFLRLFIVVLTPITARRGHLVWQITVHTPEHCQKRLKVWFSSDVPVHFGDDFQFSRLFFSGENFILICWQVDFLNIFQQINGVVKGSHPTQFSWTKTQGNSLP